ncbi:MAG: hypothetical protein JNJ55_13375, partial [Betaproteobacteria bacterium]|nr:hypothetical protein [Betaproteobacteria bacterium]
MHKFAFDWIPASNFFRRPSDGAFLMVIAWAMLAGFSWHQLVTSRNTGWRLALISSALLVAAAVATLHLSTELRFQNLVPVIACVSLLAWIRMRPALAPTLLVCVLLLHLLDLRLNNAANRHNGHNREHMAHVESLAANPVAESLLALIKDD